MSNFKKYQEEIIQSVKQIDLDKLDLLEKKIRKCWTNKQNIFICGNGGSYANALHIENDLFYPITRKEGMGIKISALGSNSSVSTCLANDEGYEKIFSYELATRGSANDLLIILSGSGNSKNIVNVLKKSEEMNIESFGLLGFDGGIAKSISNNFIHFKSFNMQICEDLQMICMNMIVQNLLENSERK